MQAEKYHDVSLQKEIESYNELHKWKPSCNVELSDQDDKQNDYTQIEPLNMIFPIMFWATFSIVAIILQTFHSRQIKKARQRNERSTLLLGRSSQIQLERFTSDNTLNTLSANPMETKEQTQDDYESQLAQSIADPNPTLKDDIAEDVSDDCNSYDFFHKSNGTSSTTRSRVTFSKEHDSIEFDNEDYIKNRILGLFDECVQEIKKQKET